jgi:hypothetical protein
MTRDILHEQQRPSGGGARVSWVSLVNDDASDIDKLIELWRAKYGYTHDKASTEAGLQASRRPARSPMRHG